MLPALNTSPDKALPDLDLQPKDWSGPSPQRTPFCSGEGQQCGPPFLPPHFRPLSTSAVPVPISLSLSSPSQSAPHRSQAVGGSGALAGLQGRDAAESIIALAPRALDPAAGVACQEEPAQRGSLPPVPPGPQPSYKEPQTL